MEEENFIDELLLEAEEKDEQQALAYQDLIITEVARLQDEMEYNLSECKREVEIINNWMLNKNAKLQERADMLKLKLETSLRESGKKTIELPHGTIRVRKSPDKFEVEDLDEFLSVATEEMLSIVPETVKPSLPKIKKHYKMSGKLPAGVKLIEGKETFSLTINNKEPKDDTKA